MPAAVTVISSVFAPALIFPPFEATQLKLTPEVEESPFNFGSVPKSIALSGPASAFGNGFTITVVVAEVAEQLFAFFTVTLNEPLLVTLIDCVTAPELQSHELPADAVSVTEPPLQNVVGPPAVIVAAGKAFTVTVAVC